MNNNQNKVMDQRETREDESQDWATLFAGLAVEAAIKAGASTAIPAAVLSAIDGATVRPIDQK
mgnify:CR=1 FL=1